MNVKISKIILYSVVAAFAFTVGLFSIWNFQSTDVLDIKGPISVEPPVAHSTQAIVLTVSYCKNYRLNGVVRTSFVGSAIEIFQPMGAESQSEGCYYNVKIPILLPPASTVPPGKYRIKFSTTYQVNPIKTATKIFYTQEFTIQ
jgi:hypothetical protein